MTSYEWTARRIIRKLKDRGWVRDDLAGEDDLIQLVIDCLLEGQPGWNDALSKAHGVAVEHKRMYPEDVFPPTGLTPDAWAAKGCRLVAENVANAILRLQQRHDIVSTKGNPD